ncbi:unnamed protein product [Diamesa serratosioi]
MKMQSGWWTAVTHNINKHHYEKTPVYHIIKDFNNNNSNNKVENVHTLPGSTYIPSHKTAAPALTIQNQHVPSSPQYRLKGADVSIGNQFYQPGLETAYEGFNSGKQEQDLEFTESLGQRFFWI